MPLTPGRSKAAFSKNVSTEMDAGKPQKQSLAIAYNIKKKNAKKKMADGGMAGDTAGQSIQDSINKRIKQGPNPSPSPVSSAQPVARDDEDDASKQAKGGMIRKRMAEGGRVDVSTNNQKRPMPENVYGDSDETRRNKGNKALKDSDWDDNPTIKQAQKFSVTKLSQPKMVGSDAFSVRNRDMHDDEADFGDRIYPETDRAQPVARDDEEEASKQGKDPSDMARQHSNGKPPYMKASENQYSEDESEEDMNKIQSPPGRYADGGEVEMEPEDSGMELDERDDEGNLLSSDFPSGPHNKQPPGEYDAINDHDDISDGLDEESPHTGETEQDMLRRHADERAKFAKGGEINPKLEQSKLEPEEGESLVKEIMGKRKRMAGGGLTDDISQLAPLAMMAMADGGEVDEDEDEDESVAQSIRRRKKMADGGQVDLNNNSRESLNDEDDMSFEAGLKEQYDDSQISPQPLDSNLKGDPRVDPNYAYRDTSVVKAIRRKMKSNRPLDE